MSPFIFRSTASVSDVLLQVNYIENRKCQCLVSHNWLQIEALSVSCREGISLISSISPCWAFCSSASSTIHQIFGICDGIGRDSVHMSMKQTLGGTHTHTTLSLAFVQCETVTKREYGNARLKQSIKVKWQGEKRSFVQSENVFWIKL